MKVKRDHLCPAPVIISPADCKAGRVYRFVEYSLPNATLFLKTETDQFFNIETGGIVTILPSARFIEVEGEYVPKG